MLHRKLEPTTKQFSAAARRLLNGYAEDISLAKLHADVADSTRREVRDALIDLFDDPGSAAYHVDDGPHKGRLLCLDLAIRYEPDMNKLRTVLGDRLATVTVTEPVFKREKAEAAITAGIVTEAELVACVAAVPRIAVVLRDAGDSRTPKGIEPGKARVTPIQLVKPLKLSGMPKA